MVEVEPMAANEDHRVRGTGATERLAAIAIDAAAVEARLGLSLIFPIDLGAHQRDEAARIMNLGLLIGAARFKQQHADFRIFREPVDDRAAGRAGADHDKVEALIIRSLGHVSGSLLAGSWAARGRLRFLRP